MKWLFFITHTLRQTEIPTLLDSWVTNTHFVKMFHPQENCLSLYFIIFIHFSMTAFPFHLLKRSKICKHK